MTFIILLSKNKYIFGINLDYFQALQRGLWASYSSTLRTSHRRLPWSLQVRKAWFFFFIEIRFGSQGSFSARYGGLHNRLTMTMLYCSGVSRTTSCPRLKSATTCSTWGAETSSNASFFSSIFNFHLNFSGTLPMWWKASSWSRSESLNNFFYMARHFKKQHTS